MDALTHITSIIAVHCERSRQTRAFRPDRALVFVNQHVVELNDIYLPASKWIRGRPCAGLRTNRSVCRPAHTILAVGRQLAGGTHRAPTTDAAPKKSAR